MENTSSIGTLAQARFQALQAQQKQAPHDHDHDQAHTQKPTEKNNSTSIEVPAAIQQLTTGSEYWVAKKTGRYQKLIREGHLADLLELAALALTKDIPAHWFATVCSVKAWERTMDFLKKRHAAAMRAVQVAERLGREMAERMRLFIYKQIWAGRSVERHAVAAQELGKHRHKLFAWLCRQEGQAAAPTRA